jgi:hypothetical protein
VGLAAAGLVTCQLFARWSDLELPPGFDHELWGLTVLNIEVGALPVVPPLYPALVALLRGIVDLPLMDAGAWISGLSHAMVAPLCFWLGRQLGAPRWAAALGGVCCLGIPELTAMGLRVQPDALTSVALLLAALVADNLLRAPSRLTVFALALTCALLPLLREHGWGVALLAIGLCAVSPGSWRARLGRAAVGGLGFLAGPMLFGIPPAPPWLLPWSMRIQMMATDMVQGRMPKAGEAMSRGCQRAGSVGTAVSGG